MDALKPRTPRHRHHLAFVHYDAVGREIKAVSTCHIQPSTPQAQPSPGLLSAASWSNPATDPAQATSPARETSQ
ncbi:UNVERIFIED_CONTAM: hypothetical protein QOZ72_29050, partial [Pseudomonas aeruginosa]